MEVLEESPEDLGRAPSPDIIRGPAVCLGSRGSIVCSDTGYVFSDVGLNYCPKTIKDTSVSQAVTLSVTSQLQ